MSAIGEDGERIPTIGHLTYGEFMAVHEIEGQVRVEIGWEGEGQCGEFDPSDLNDEPLLRFTAIDLAATDEEHDRGWQDNSYCTSVPADTPVEELEAFCRALAEAVAGEPSWKRILEQWSWSNRDDTRRALETYGGGNGDEPGSHGEEGCDDPACCLQGSSGEDIVGTIRLPDGYNGDFVDCESEPIEKDGDLYKLRVKDSYLIKWCTRQQWEDAMREACAEGVQP